jgi:membrane protein implicated in regulation of membrane protease activity
MYGNGQDLQWRTNGNRWVRPALSIGTAYLVVIDLVLLFASAVPAQGVLLSILTILFVLLSENFYRRPQVRIDPR